MCQQHKTPQLISRCIETRAQVDILRAPQFGLLMMLVLPDFPDTWRALSAEERRVANRRLALEADEADVDDASGRSHLRGIKDALTDPKTYLLAVAYHGQTGAAGIQNYFPTLTETVESNHIDALLLCAPPYLFMVFWSYAHSRLSDRLGMRFWFFVYPIPITIVGFIGEFFFLVLETVAVFLSRFRCRVMHANILILR